MIKSHQKRKGRIATVTTTSEKATEVATTTTRTVTNTV